MSRIFPGSLMRSRTLPYSLWGGGGAICNQQRYIIRESMVCSGRWKVRLESALEWVIVVSRRALLVEKSLFSAVRFIRFGRSSTARRGSMRIHPRRLERAAGCTVFILDRLLRHYRSRGEQARTTNFRCKIYVA